MSPHSPNTPANARKVFGYRPGTDGTENTFDIVHLPTNSVIAAIPFWEAEGASRQAARRLVRGLNALHHCGGYVYAAQWLEVGEILHSLSTVEAIA